VDYLCGVDLDGKDCPDAVHSSPDKDDSLVSTGEGILNQVEGWIGIDKDDTASSNSIERAAKAAKNADYVVVCVGEGPYAEKPGM
jgi:hypothetical protein